MGEKEALEHYWNLSIKEHATIDFLGEEEKQLLKEALFIDIQSHIHFSAGKQKKWKRGFYRRVVAATLFLALVGVVLHQYFHVAQLKYATAYGQTKKIVLPDSSVVILNAHSTLSIPEYWGKHTDERQVWLDGEAFFEVKKQHGATFIVFIGDVAVEVLGTSFNVNTRRGKTQVVLNTGKVTIKTKKQQEPDVVMKPGDLVELTDGTATFTRKVVDPEDYSAWRYKKLILKKTPVRKVAEMFQDYYGIKMLFKDKEIEQRKVTGSIPTDNIAVFLEMVSASLQVKVTRTEDEVWVENQVNANQE